MLRKLLTWLSPGAGTGRARADTLIERGLASERQGDLRSAERHFRAAVAASPNYPTAQVNLGVALEALGKGAAAARAYEAALALDSGHPYASFNLGKALLLSGDAARAEALLHGALQSKPDFPEALVVLASMQMARGDSSGAQQSLQSALALRPDYALGLRNLGMLLYKLRNWHEAADTLQRAAAAEPANPDAHFWLGNALVQMHRPVQAEAAFRAALAGSPDFAEAWCNLGNVLADRGVRDEAVRCFEKALAVNSGYADAHVGLGNVFAGTGRLEQAAACYRRALSLDARIADAEVNLGNVLKDQGLWREALQHYDAALALSPRSAEARWARAMCHIPAVRGPDESLPAIRERFAAELDGLERWFDAGHAADGWKAVGVAQPFWLAYQDADNVALLQQYGRLCAGLMASWQARQTLAPAVRRSRGTLRVGIVSQFFRNHSVWNAIVKGWFQELDRERVTLSAFCLGAANDSQTRYARSRADRFVQDIGGLPQWAEAIAAEQPDVLIYPEIGMDPLSVKLASLRLARVQAASWGHPETTGLPTIDFYLSAVGLEPDDAQRHYSERLITLPNLGGYVQPEQVDAAAPELGGFALESGVPLLICAGTPFKYAPEHDRLFVDIARRLGRCRMLFFDYQTRALSSALRARLAEIFNREGLEFDKYVSFVPWQTREGFFGLLDRADVLLDSIGFSGFNTSLQAVQCTLPIVAFEGRFLRGRLASGILRRLGLAELVASSLEDFVTITVRLAADRTYRDGVRRRMAAARSVLYEDPAAIRALEGFLAQAG